MARSLAEKVAPRQGRDGKEWRGFAWSSPPDAERLLKGRRDQAGRGEDNRNRPQTRGQRAPAKPPIQRAGTRRALLIRLLQAPEGARANTILAAAGMAGRYGTQGNVGAPGEKSGAGGARVKERFVARVFRINPRLA